MNGDSGEMVVKYADYADAAGKPDIPIRVAVTRSTMMRTVAKKSGVICTRIRGGDLFVRDHRIVCLDDTDVANVMQEMQ